MDLFEMLQMLTEIPGPSGDEQRIADQIEQLWKPYVDSVERDRIGNLFAIKRGKKKEGAETPRLLIAAHMDEIALMVRKIEAYPEEDGGYGYLRVSNVGGVDRRPLYGQLVTVHGKRPLRGVIGALPITQLPSERMGKPYNYDELFVDVGLTVEELRATVSVGDFVSFHQPLRKLLNERVAGKALDNRASVAAVTVALEYLSERHHQWDIIAAATAQEETRLLGAVTGAYSQRPQAAIALDVTFGKGPGARESTTFEIDGGPTLGLGPNVHPGIYKKLKDVADGLEMTVHTDPHTEASGTDAFGLQIAREGVPTGLIGIPLRYMHTQVETLATSDIERTGRLLGEFAARLDGEFLDEMVQAMMNEM